MVAGGGGGGGGGGEGGGGGRGGRRAGGDGAPVGLGGRVPRSRRWICGRAFRTDGCGARRTLRLRTSVANLAARMGRVQRVPSTGGEASAGGRACCCVAPVRCGAVRSAQLRSSSMGSRRWRAHAGGHHARGCCRRRGGEWRVRVGEDPRRGLARIVRRRRCGPAAGRARAGSLGQGRHGAGAVRAVQAVRAEREEGGRKAGGEGGGRSGASSDRSWCPSGALRRLEVSVGGKLGAW
jgi:hypothetical protein